MRPDSTAAGRQRAERWAIVGAGWSGLACAVDAIGRGVGVTLIDAAPAAGGRARRVDLRIGDAEYAVDNGQHLLLGACSEVLELMRRVGVDPRDAFLFRPFAVSYPDGWCLATVRAPAPFHLALGLAFTSKLPWAHRAAMARFVSRVKRSGWTADAGSSVAGLLSGQPPELIRRLWRPLCIAAMNAEPEHCSAVVFLNLLRLSLGGARGDSDILLMRRDLSATMPVAAIDHLQRRGATILLRQAALGLTRRGDGWSLALREGSLDFDRVVVAVPAEPAARLLESAALDSLAAPIRQLRALQYESLATVYLAYPPGIRLPAPMLVLDDDAASGRFGQWVFDRGAIDAANGSILGVVVGGPVLRGDIDPARLCDGVVHQMQHDFGLAPPIAHRIVVERRATLLCSPGLQRPRPQLPVAGLYLAGDVADSPFPSTLEGSVRAGLEAARLASADREALGP
jgi:hydroxysqualene dehydroxylase